jgi:hypothetical protein
MDRAIVEAKKYTTRPITATFADIDNIIGTNPSTDLLPRFRQNMANFDAFAFQIYRGSTFGSYFDTYASEAGGKPLIIAEYGLDAMNDPCGWPQNQAMQPCTIWSPGQNGQPGGSEDTGAAFQGCTTGGSCAQPGVVAQADWDARLAKEIDTHPAVLGGFIFEYADEWWKNVETQDHCTTVGATLPPREEQTIAERLHGFVDSPSILCVLRLLVPCSLPP